MYDGWTNERERDTGRGLSRRKRNKKKEGKKERKENEKKKRNLGHIAFANL